MKAIVGSWDHRPYQLLAEITALRTRVRELEQALQREREENDALRALLADEAPVEVDFDAVEDGVQQLEVRA